MTRRRRGSTALLVVLATLGTLLWWRAAPAQAATVRPIQFPVEGPVRFRSDFGNPRVGHTHAGNDIMGDRLQPLLAAADGTVVRQRVESGNAGNYLVIRDAAGWEYLYLHVNNDSPGTDDGANPPAWRFAPGIGVGARVRSGQHVGWLGDSGNAESTPPHLHFEIHPPGAGAIDPWPSLRAARGIPVGSYCDTNRNPPRFPDAETAAGWWQAGTDGAIFSFGDVGYLGSGFGRSGPNETVGLAAVGNRGYWQASRQGVVAGHGLPHFGDLTGGAITAPVVDLAARRQGDGYWLLGGDGGVFTFGEARFFGSTGAMKLNRPAVGMAPTPTGDGYWLVASDGGIFTFGDAAFLGSTGALRLNEPVVDVTPTPTGLGYWLLGRDGGLFAFGDAAYFGSVPGTGSCGPLDAVAIETSPTGLGYWIQSADGRVWSFGDAAVHADTAKEKVPARIVDLAVARQ